MLEKIDFKPGVLLSSLFLNSIQKSSSFNFSPRTDYYNLPTEMDESLWPVGQRDSVKDWELAEPTTEPTAVGRLAYDGKILGCINCQEEDTDLAEIVFGPPVTVRKDPFTESLLENDALGVIVNSGSVYYEQIQSQFGWPSQVVIVQPGRENYIYASIIKLEDEFESVILTSGERFPSRARKYIPLAILNISETGEILSYEDVRNNTLIDSIINRDLSNSDIISESLEEPVEVWKRNLVDTANGSLVLKLPDAVDSDRVSFLDLAGTFARNPLRVQVQENSEDTINGEFQIDFDIRDSHVSLVYVEALKQWRIENIDYSELDQSALGKFISCGGQYCIGITNAEDCPNGFAIPPVFPERSEGFFRYEPVTDTTGKCFKVLNPSIAVYSDGQGGFLQIDRAQRCGRRSEKEPLRDEFATLYVDQSRGEDSIINTGENPEVPFRTIERALIQAARREKLYSIKVAPGEYYVDNAPGSSAIVTGQKDTGFHNWIDTEYTVFNFNEETNVLVLNEDESSEVYPPRWFQVGGVIYSESGAVANIKSVYRKKVCAKDCGWTLELVHRRGIFSRREKIYVNDLSVVNSSSGGIIVSHGTSIIGEDLRKTIIRPSYVPSQHESYIFKLTRNAYIKELSFMDNLNETRTHDALTCLGFAAEADIEEKGENFPYFEKIYYLWGDDALNISPNKDDLDIVAMKPMSILDRHIDIQENLTGIISPDASLEEEYYRFPGKINKYEPGTNALIKIPDINSVANSSPYVHNCSVRSVFGLSGVHADGNLVRGFKSMLVAGLTCVSLQLDPDCYDAQTYFAEPPNKKYKDHHRHFSFKASNGGYIQVVNCFSIASADHFLTVDGGEMSLLSCASNFGDKALISKGYAKESLLQDYGEETVLSKIIPPKPLEGEYIRSKLIDTGLILAKEPTVLYHENNQSGPYRLYIRNKNINPLFTENNPPSKDSLEDNQFSYTRVVNGNIEFSNPDSNSIELFSLNNQQLSGRINSISDHEQLDSHSRIFYYDDNPPYNIDLIGQMLSYGSRILSKEVASPTEADEYLEMFGPLGSFLLINNNIYTLRDKYKTNNTVYLKIDRELEDSSANNLYQVSKVYSDYIGPLWYIDIGENNIFPALNNVEDKTAIFIPRDYDLRIDEEKVYMVEISGYKSQLGKREPQEYYILEEQYNINAGSDLNDHDPIVIKNITPQGNGVYRFTPVMASDSKKEIVTPVNNIDNIKANEDPEESITRKAIERLFSRENYYIGNSHGEITSPGANFESLDVFYYLEDTKLPLRIELRRPSMLRASGFAWEWAGYLNYDTALPTLQSRSLDKKSYMLSESHGGKIFASGMDQEGKCYVTSAPEVI